MIFMNSVTINIPQSLYQRLEQASVHLQKPVQEVLTETLQAALPFAEEIPEAIRAEVAALSSMDEKTLQKVAESTMAYDEQQAMDQLLDLQRVRVLDDSEITRLESLRAEYGRILLRKARAFALLTKHGVSYSLE